jgi:hypothetical protein
MTDIVKLLTAGAVAEVDGVKWVLLDVVKAMDGGTFFTAIRYDDSCPAVVHVILVKR